MTVVLILPWVRYGKARQSSREREWKEFYSLEIQYHAGLLRGSTQVCHEAEAGREIAGRLLYCGF